MKFWTYAIVDNKTHKIIKKPTMVYAKDRKTIEYLALTSLPKAYKKKLDQAEILIRDEFPNHYPTSGTASIYSAPITLSGTSWTNTCNTTDNSLASFTTTAANIK